MGRDGRRYCVRECMHTFLNGTQYLLVTGKIAQKKRLTETHCSVPAFTTLTRVDQSDWDNRNPRPPISLRQFCQFDEPGPERKKGVEVGFGRGVRVDVGIGLRKNDEDFSGAKQPDYIQGYMSEILSGLVGSVCFSPVHPLLKKLFAAQDNRPVCHRTAKLYHEAQWSCSDPIQRDNGVQATGNTANQGISIVEIMEMARGNQHGPGAWKMFQAFSVQVQSAPAYDPTASTH